MRVGNYRGIKGPGEGQELKQDTSHGPDIRFEVILHSLTQLRRHVVRGTHTLEQGQI